MMHTHQDLHLSLINEGKHTQEERIERHWVTCSLLTRYVLCKISLLNLIQPWPSHFPSFIYAPLPIHSRTKGQIPTLAGHLDIENYPLVTDCKLDAE